MQHVMFGLIEWSKKLWGTKHKCNLSLYCYAVFAAVVSFFLLPSLSLRVFCFCHGWPHGWFFATSCAWLTSSYKLKFCSYKKILYYVDYRLKLEIYKHCWYNPAPLTISQRLTRVLDMNDWLMNTTSKTTLLLSFFLW
jgi:hypothetical protein